MGSQAETQGEAKGSLNETGRNRRITSAMTHKATHQRQPMGNNAKGDNRHSYFDLKLDLPDKNRYNVNYKLVCKKTPKIEICRLHQHQGKASRPYTPYSGSQYCKVC